MNGGDHYRRLLEDDEDRRGRIDSDDPFRAEPPRYLADADDGDEGPGADMPPERSGEWVVTVLAGLYAEAVRQGKAGFLPATRWVLRTAVERLSKPEVDVVPMQLLQGIYLAVGPRQPLRLLWRHRGRVGSVAAQTRKSA